MKTITLLGLLMLCACEQNAKSGPMPEASIAFVASPLPSASPAEPSTHGTDDAAQVDQRDWETLDEGRPSAHDGGWPEDGRCAQ